MSLLAQPRVILVVEDEADLREGLTDILESGLQDVRVVAVPHAHAALEALQATGAHLILSDYRLPGMDGIEFLRRAHDLAPRTPRLLMTAYADMDLALRAMREASIENFFPKPLDPHQLLDVAGVLLASLEEPGYAAFSPAPA